jgi:hypothetical protein
VQNVASHIFECGGLIPFLSVLQRPDEHQRIWALKIVARMLQIATPAQYVSPTHTHTLQPLWASTRWDARRGLSELKYRFISRQ